MNIVDYVVQEGLVMIPVLFIIGEIVKGTETIENKYIPVILLGLSLVLTPFVLGGYTAGNIVQSILVAGVTVFGNEIIKQSSKGDVK